MAPSRVLGNVTVWGLIDNAPGARPVPVSVALTVLPGVAVTVTVAVFAAALVGWKLAVMVQLVPDTSVPLQVVASIWNSAAFVPDSFTAIAVVVPALALPVFVTVSALAVLALSTATDGNACVVGAKVNVTTEGGAPPVAMPPVLLMPPAKEVPPVVAPPAGMLVAPPDPPQPKSAPPVVPPLEPAPDPLDPTIPPVDNVPPTVEPPMLVTGTPPAPPALAPELDRPVDTARPPVTGSGITPSGLVSMMVVAIDHIFCLAPSISPPIEPVVSRTKATSTVGLATACERKVVGNKKNASAIARMVMTDFMFPSQGCKGRAFVAPGRRMVPLLRDGSAPELCPAAYKFGAEEMECVC